MDVRHVDLCTALPLLSGCNGRVIPPCTARTLRGRRAHTHVRAHAQVLAGATKVLRHHLADFVLFEYHGVGKWGVTQLADVVAGLERQGGCLPASDLSIAGTSCVTYVHVHPTV
jgi:hypothetical protein